MREEELMFNDLVKYPVGDSTIVGYIHTSTFVEHDKSLDECVDYEDTHFGKMIPLEIVDEDFEKNGFDVYLVGDRKYWFRQKDNPDGTEKYNIDIEKEDGYYIVTARNEGMICKSVKYMHQLQQVLRIVGLEEIADDFKKRYFLK